MQTRHHGADRYLEGVSDLSVRQVVEVAKHQDLALCGIEPRDRNPEQLAALACDGVSLGIGPPVGESAGEVGSAGVERLVPADLSPPPVISCPVSHDREEPGPDGSAPLEAIERGEEAEHCVLGDVERIVGIADQLQSKEIRCPPMRARDLLASAGLTFAGSRKKLPGLGRGQGQDSVHTSTTLVPTLYSLARAVAEG